MLASSLFGLFRPGFGGARSVAAGGFCAARLTGVTAKAEAAIGSGATRRYFGSSSLSSDSSSYRHPYTNDAAQSWGGGPGQMNGDGHPAPSAKSSAGFARSEGVKEQFSKEHSLLQAERAVPREKVVHIPPIGNIVRYDIGRNHILYTNEEVADKFVRILTKKGNKAMASIILSKALQYAKEHELKENQYSQAIDMYAYLAQCVHNVMPLIEHTRKYKGGRIVFIPRATTPRRAQKMGIRLIVQSVNGRGVPGAIERLLANELTQAFRKQGKAWNKMIDLHKFAEANRTSVSTVL